MSALQRWIFVIYFVTHIPITLFVDMQALLPSSWYPRWATELLKWYLNAFQDPLMVLAVTDTERSDLNWFKSFCACELLLQLPLFFILAWGYLRRVPTASFQLTAFAYGIHVATTLVPIMYTLYPMGRYDLMAVYSPYLIIPLWVAYSSGRRLLASSKSKSE